MKKCLSIALILLAFINSSAQTAEEKNVWSRVEALTKAIFETKDSAALLDLVSKKVTYGHSGGEC